MKKLWLLSAAALVICGASLPAQNPNVNPTGKIDSIYALAVDPSAHPNDAVIWLLDEGVYRVEADGRTSQTFRQVV